MTGRVACAMALPLSFSDGFFTARKAKAMGWPSHTYEHERPGGAGADTGSEDTTNERQFDRADGNRCPYLLLAFDVPCAEISELWPSLAVQSADNSGLWRRARYNENWAIKDDLPF